MRNCTTDILVFKEIIHVYCLIPICLFLVCLSLIYLAALQIHCSAQCKDLLEALGGYTLQERGLVPMKVGYIFKSGINSVRLVHRSVWYHFYAKCEISKKNVVVINA